MPRQISHDRPHDSTVRSSTLDLLARFQRSYPRTSVRAAGTVWSFRRTPGQGSPATAILMLPGIQGGGDVFFHTALRLPPAPPPPPLHPPNHVHAHPLT